MQRVPAHIIRSITVERDTGMDVGCKRDAYRATIGDLSNMDPQTGRAMRGLQRSCYIDDRGRIIYKVPNGMMWNASQRIEFEQMYREIAEAGLSAFRTPCALFTMPNGLMVIAMPYRPVQGRALSPAQEQRLHDALRNAAAHGYQVPDMHEGNYRGTVAGRPKITDLGFEIRRPFVPSSSSPSTPTPSSTIGRVCACSRCRVQPLGTHGPAVWNICWPSGPSTLSCHCTACQAQCVSTHAF